jgi:hypothetical protein
VVDVVDLALAVAQTDQRLDRPQMMSSLRSTRMVSGASSSRRMFIFTRPTADRS